MVRRERDWEIEKKRVQEKTRLWMIVVTMATAFVVSTITGVTLNR